MCMVLEQEDLEPRGPVFTGISYRPLRPDVSLKIQFFLASLYLKNEGLSTQSGEFQISPGQERCPKSSGIYPAKGAEIPGLRVT